MGVVVGGSKAGWGGKEIFKGSDIDEDGEIACRQWQGKGSNCGSRYFDNR